MSSAWVGKTVAGGEPPGESRAELRGAKMYDPLRAKAKIVLYTVVAFLFGVGMASGMGWTSSSASTTPPRAEASSILTSFVPQRI